MITIYLDHNIIDGFDKGETAYLEPVFANAEYLPIISVVSIDEIFRGGNQSRSIKNIESLKKLGVKYIHSGPDELHMSIGELDYHNMYQKWLQMQSDIGPLNNSHFLFISTLYRESEPMAVQDMEQAIIAKIDWIKSNYDKFPILQTQMNEILENPEKYKLVCKQLIGLKKLIPFTSKEINNIPENSVFWNCVERLKKSTSYQTSNLGKEIEDAIENEKTIDNKLLIVFTWLNLFGYYPDNFTRIERIRPNHSDALHATYGIKCDALLTSDRRFAKRIAAAISALKLETEVDTDANKLLHRITKKSGSQ
jgi:hypothetical protein